VACFRPRVSCPRREQLNIYTGDLFAGCGGLTTGLQSAGFQTRWANEFWAPAAATYRISNPEVTLYEEDVRSLLARAVDSTDLREKLAVDLLCGGPPCQGFSGWNRFRSLEDPRNSLVEVFLDFVALLEPRLVLIENVTGMLSLGDGRVVSGVTEALGEMGYQVRLMVLQAGGYGVPQNRWRVFIGGSKDESGLLNPPMPIHAFPRTTVFNATSFRSQVIRPPLKPSTELLTSTLPHVTVADALADLPPLTNGSGLETSALGPAQCEFQSMLRTDSSIVTCHRTVRLEDINMDRVRALQAGQSWIHLPEHLKPNNLKNTPGQRYPNRFGRLEWTGIFNTIINKAEPYWSRVIHPRDDRVISVRESARAQGLPDKIHFEGPLRQQYAQVGNSVPPPLARAIGWEMRRALGDRHVNEEIEAYRTKMHNR
jgi:DNA (cytosine-5)-methyltransferase 1